jgi:Asp-tRNA(Asn)/Glu-tRNA(Gln) amidotransferase A subunit family amidase
VKGDPLASPEPQDRRVDRRAFLARMGALGTAAALGTPLRISAGTAVLGASRPTIDAGPFWDAAARSVGAVDSPAELSATEAGVLLRRGELTARDLVEACLERIGAWDSTYEAFNQVTALQARERADALDRDGEPGLLHGIPLAIKDNFHTRGILTTANSHIYRDFVPDRDATAVARLKAAGGVILGKTQMGPLATTRALTPDGDITTVNAWTPWNPSVSPGGSSSGSATSVASRMALSSIGTQTGGSITVPSLAQGLTGLKPTMGRVSLRGVIPLTYSRDHVGPLARDARDAALMLQAMAGPDADDPRTLGLPEVPDYLTAATPTGEGSSARLRWATRMGVLPGWADGDGPGAAERRAFLTEMESAGAELVEIVPSERWRELSSSLFNAVRLPERTEPFMEYLRQDVRLFGVTLNSWMQGLFMSGDEFLKGQRARHSLLSLTLGEIFEACDVVVQTGHVPFDMVGLPLLALPTGFRETDEGLRPLGILLGAPPFGEERLLSVGAAWQARTDHHRVRPPLLSEVEASRPTPPRSGRRGRLDAETVAELSE